MRLLAALTIAIGFGLVSVASAGAQSPGAAAPAEQTQGVEAAGGLRTRNASGTVKSATADGVVVTGTEKGEGATWTFAAEPTTNTRKGARRSS